MQKAIVVKRGNAGASIKELNQYLAAGWVVEKMEAFHPSHAVSSSGQGYSNLDMKDYGAILVIIEDLGVEDSETRTE